MGTPCRPESTSQRRNRHRHIDGFSGPGDLLRETPVIGFICRNPPMAEKVARQPPISVAMTKTTVNRLAYALDDLASHMDVDQFAIASKTEDTWKASPPSLNGVSQHSAEGEGRDFVVTSPGASSPIGALRKAKGRSKPPTSLLSRRSECPRRGFTRRILNRPKVVRPKSTSPLR